MKKIWVALAAIGLLGCSKNPDNAMTRYGENLATAEQKAQAAADKANATIAQHQNIYNQTAHQEGQDQ
jgi:hypothetical protein